jgi:hypothetical protein
MILASDIPKLSKVEKLTMMELLWSDLASSTDELESPAWHRVEVQGAENRYLAGEEKPVDWNVAKEQLRSGRG